MSIKHLCVLALLLAWFHSAETQQSAKIRRIGFVSRDFHPSDSRAPAPVNRDAFRQGLRDLGYVEGQNIIIEYRYADGRFERLRALAEELVRLNIDIIVTDTAASARAAATATSTIPIVVSSGSDPIRSGLATSLARPGGNVTGLTNLIAELLPKRLELLKEVAPMISRFAYLDHDDNSGDNSRYEKDAQATAQALGISLQRVEVKARNPDFGSAFHVMVRDRIGGFITSAGLLNVTVHRRRILQLAEHNRMPSISATHQWINDGGLMYYGANIPDLYRRAASFVDRILKGAQPADLPIERPTKYVFGINLKAAKQIGLNIPPHVLARADRVIK